MALFTPYKITSTQLDSLPIQEGQFIVTTDSKELYFDTASATRIKLYEGLDDDITSIEADISSINNSAITSIQKNGTALTVSNHTVNITVPTTTGELTNNSGFITKSVSNLTNYYLKTQTYSQTEVNNLIGQISTISISVVDSLPTTGKSNIIYLVPKTGSTNDVHDEYLWISDTWELIGSTAVDLTGYATETWVNTQISDFLTETEINNAITTAFTNKASSTTPKANGTAATGSETAYARGDHVHPAQTTITGNAGTATTLQTARKINGTSFNGSADITTTNWGTARNISIADSSKTNTGAAVSVNGSAAATLLLPATIKAALSGNATTATTLATSRAIDGVAFNGSAAITHYGTCSTAAATTAKVVSCTGFSLVTGARIIVKFTVTNTGAVASLTLNVNSTGAKSIKYRNGNLPSVGTLAANRMYEFVYDGTYYQLVGDLDTNTTYSVATTSSNGLMSSSDKTKLDGLSTTTGTTVTVSSTEPSSMNSGDIWLILES